MLSDIFQSYAFQTALKSSFILGLAAGMAGPFAALQKKSLEINAISCGAFAGALLSFVITGSKNPLITLGGAAGAGFLALILLKAVYKAGRADKSVAQCLMAAVFFSGAAVLLTHIQRSDSAIGGGLEKFLFGEAATLLKEETDVAFFACSAAVILLTAGIKRFETVIFDENYAKTAGLSVNFYKWLLALITLAVIVTGIQVMGAVLMSVLFAAPAAAAKQWTGRFVPLVFLSAFFGGVSGAAGGAASAGLSSVPTGPAIAATAGAIALFSVFFRAGRNFIISKRRLK